MGRASKSRLLLWLALPLVVELASWSPLLRGEYYGIDPSWQAGLEMAVRSHIAFGTHALFTYGPLGFLNVAVMGGGFMWFAALAHVGFLYAVLARFALASAVYFGARRMFGVWWGALVAILVLRCGQSADLPILLIALVWGLGSDANLRAQRCVAVLGGAFAALELLEKVSLGAAAAGLVALFVLSLPRARARTGAAALGAFVLALLILWLVAGEPISALPQYLRGAEQVSSGYSAAMSIPYPPPFWLKCAAWFSAAVGLWGAWVTTAGFARRQRVGVFLLWICFVYAAYKEGFTRTDVEHLLYYFLPVLNGLFAFRWLRWQRFVAAVAIAAVGAFTLYTDGQSVTGVGRLDQGVRYAVSDTHFFLFAPSELSASIAGGRAYIESVDQTPKRVLALLHGRTVAVFPYELTAAWAYNLEWDPIPVLQSYAAYTPWLDRLDAQFIDSSQAPQRILLQPGSTSLDFRVLSYDEPETSVAMFCRYRLMLATAKYAVLGRARDRCGGEHLIGVVHAGWNQPVNAPRPGRDSMVLVRITGVQVHGLESIGNLLGSPASRWVDLNSSPAPNRLIEANAADGLPLSASPGLDYPAPYATTSDVKTLAIAKSGQNPTTHGPLTYSFYSLKVKPWS